MVLSCGFMGVFVTNEVARWLEMELHFLATFTSETNRVSLLYFSRMYGFCDVHISAN